MKRIMGAFRPRFRALQSEWVPCLRHYVTRNVSPAQDGNLARRARLPMDEVRSVLGEDPWPCEGLGLWATLRQMVRDDFARWRASRALAAASARRAGGRLDRGTLRRVRQLARREMALMQQARLLAATQRVFRFWHVVHRPFAIAALAAVLVHVSVAVIMGATWAW